MLSHQTEIWKIDHSQIVDFIVEKPTTQNAKQSIFSILKSTCCCIEMTPTENSTLCESWKWLNNLCGAWNSHSFVTFTWDCIMYIWSTHFHWFPQLQLDQHQTRHTIQELLSLKSKPLQLPVRSEFNQFQSAFEKGQCSAEMHCEMKPCGTDDNPGAGWDWLE